MSIDSYSLVPLPLPHARPLPPSPRMNRSYCPSSLPIPVVPPPSTPPLRPRFIYTTPPSSIGSSSPFCMMRFFGSLVPSLSLFGIFPVKHRCLLRRRRPMIVIEVALYLPMTLLLPWTPSCWRLLQVARRVRFAPPGGIDCRMVGSPPPCRLKFVPWQRCSPLLWI